MYSLPQKVYFVPALRSEPNSFSSETGNCRCARTASNSCPTAPEAPTIAITILSQSYNGVSFSFGKGQFTFTSEPTESQKEVLVFQFGCFFQSLDTLSTILQSTPYDRF